mgnify:CR=1 FL=1
MRNSQDVFPCPEEFTLFRMRHDAKKVLDTIPLRGLDSLSFPERRRLKYGRTAGLFSDEDIQMKQEEYCRFRKYLSSN